MELGEGEAQICRLCGQYESIYIDVFGEEGTKRFLGLKIHTKVNILVKENDGLPQIVCMRCLGTLEFLCDFYERCHLTQKELLETSQNTMDEKIQQNSDEESDKENAIPSINETKQKAEVLSPDNSKSTKKYPSENNMSYYRTEIKEENANHVKNNTSTNGVHLVTQTTVQLNKRISKNHSVVDNENSNRKISKNDQNDTNNLRCKRNLIIKKNNTLRKTAIRTRSTNDLNSSQKNKTNISINLDLPVRRKRGRKSKLEKMREMNLAASFKKNIQTDSSDRMTENLNNEYKRRCLRTICTNSKSNNISNNASISSKLQVSQTIAKEKVVVVNTSLDIDYTKGNETNTMYSDNIVTNKVIEIGPDSKSTVKSNKCMENTKDKSAKDKAISVIVKQEKEETENTSIRQNEKSNQHVWISSEIQKDKNTVESQDQNQIHQKKTNLTQTISSETKGSKSSKNTEINLAGQNSDIETHSTSTNLHSKVFTEQNRVTVIKSSQSNEISNPKMMQEDSTELFIAVDIGNQSTESELKCNLSEQSQSQQFSQDSFDGTKCKDRSFGKISELISDEQKQTIETYYTVDMSIVNSEEVQKNITIVNKKNIRCNICGTFYLRMDKCQVHIWGHLQMKPYQCKACDFATVTVSNVRCHIRKSHLKIKPFACHLCEKRYVTAILLEEHINTHTGARPYKCKLCDFASSSRQILSYHNATHKPLKDINCKLCGKEFYSKSRLRAHMIVHNKDKAVMCKLCSAYLSNTEALETHHRNIHMQDYVCNICGKHVKSRKALHNHQNVHAAAKYKCTLCPNVYKSSQILKEHLLKHEGIRKYKCNVCGKSFGQQSHLAAHMAVHSKIRFHCPGCDKPFNRQDNMKIHTKRCKLFLANPDLKNLLSKRERTISFNNIAELTAELKNGNMTNSGSQVSLKDQNNGTLAKTVEGQKKTAINLCKLGLNISCIEPIDKTWNSDNIYNEKEATRSAEVNIIKFPNVNDRLVSDTENISVLENVLEPESY
ncbi:PREDICTED: zinc finger protein 227-like [Eufriesea mexicana]|uniref:zinc finger protein 227-like n=1 Tax=Eufriesea mexicana TaxID=516756 RepID=UPI00083C0837|nr:PREDICTED: zinc finger protein 227-like [Eufriesea mexicana]